MSSEIVRSTLDIGVLAVGTLKARTVYVPKIFSQTLGGLETQGCCTLPAGVSIRSADICKTTQRAVPAKITSMNFLFRILRDPIS